MSGKIKILFLAAMFLIAALAAGCDPNVTTTSPGPVINKEQSSPPEKVAAETVSIVVYHTTKDAIHLVPEVHVVPKTAHPAQDALELLQNEPQNRDLVKVLPEGVKSRGVTVKDHVAYADFNDKLIKNNVGGSATEVLIVGAIVNTLTEFPEIHKVQILVEGKKVDTLSGHMDVGEPLSRSEQIIKKAL